VVDALGYVRKVREKGIDKQTQTAAINSFVVANGMELKRIFDETDGSLDIKLRCRSIGRKLLESVKSGDAIIVSSLDRLFLDPSDALETIQQLIGLGVRLLPIDLGVNVAVPSGVLILQSIVTAQTERHALRIRIAKKKGQMAGSFVGGRLPFGYDLVEGRLVQNAQQQQLIKQAVDLYRHKKMSYREVADRLNDKGGFYVSHVTVGRWIRNAT
jgi:putative DNA-invertase from lambdoid prophage Rac